jgi:hypothetical protein
MILIFTAAVGINAETFNHQKGGISIWFPDHWKITTDDDLLEAEAPDEDAYAQLLVLKDVTSLEQASEIYANELDKIVTDFKVTLEEDNLQLNGLELFIVEGQGKVEGVTLDIGAAIILTKKAIVMMITFNLPEVQKKYEKIFEKIAGSLNAI